MKIGRELQHLEDVRKDEDNPTMIVPASSCRPSLGSSESRESHRAFPAGEAVLQSVPSGAFRERECG